MRNRKGHSIPSSLDDAIQCQLATAEKLGLVPKRMADLMGVDVKTYYRWMHQPAIEAQQEIVIPGVISGTREQLAEAAAQARVQRQPIPAKSVPSPALRLVDVAPTPAPSNVLSLPDTPDARYRYFCTLRDRHQRGEPLGERELDWLLNKYVRTNEYRTLSQR